MWSITPKNVFQTCILSFVVLNDWVIKKLKCREIGMQLDATAYCTITTAFILRDEELAQLRML